MKFVLPLLAVALLIASEFDTLAFAELNDLDDERELVHRSVPLREAEAEPLHDHGYRAYKAWRRAHHAGERHHAFSGKIDPEHLHHIISHDAHGQRPVYSSDVWEDEL
eukprot:CAMPEP_0118926802 /NCGR_PEP_ID=MMETSP1169-20130426/4419_1 /TAXON_ID=36882 /ORGANISM="Pyramimonas obovata, Strain CCMP722" /LENGTH=107 /DNA_ID=CAMNT_0006868431 /DNA_START=1 /DNA_END=324 /DNA_ORIENTATION=-